MIRKLSVGLRAISAFSLIGLLVIILGGFSILRLHVLNDEILILAKERAPALDTAGNMLSDFYKINLEIANLMMADQEDHTQINLNLQLAEADFEENFQRMRELVHTTQLSNILKEIHSSLATFETGRKEQILMLQKGEHIAAKSLQQDKLKTLQETIVRDIHKLVADQTEHIEQSISSTQEMFTTSVELIVIVSILAIILVVMFAVIFTRSIIIPINTALTGASFIAKGDLTHSIADEGNDEMTQLNSSLSKMQQSLRETINLIQDSSTQLASTSEELSVVTEQSTRGLHLQHEQLEQAATSVTELTAAISGVAESASITSNESDLAHAHSESGLRKVNQTIETVSTLLSSLENTLEGVDNLAIEVKNISQVLEVIRGIAEQTNLLALNAAIEAARAGETGRGFAVVADEVRALAHRTQQATKEIESMIDSVQSGTNITVNSMRHSHEQAKNTLDIASQSGEVIKVFAQSVTRIKDQNVMIASAAEEQATVSQEVDRNLVAVKELSTETAAGATETSASSIELARLAEQLNELTRRFKI
mgnify:CR=1 FL=1|tara:strand:- start:521 stop:2140 length:1620 start_codon:yes stop_codon:yes gene_type:complete